MSQSKGLLHAAVRSRLVGTLSALSGSVFLLLATVLASAPVEAPRTAPLRAKLDVAGMIASTWYVPESRAHIEAALDNARGTFLGESTLNGEGLLMVLPVIGPWTAALQDDVPLAFGDRALLYTAGLLQLVGISLGAMQLFEGEGLVAKGPVLSVSPIAGGQLGVSVRITGF
jgi:hypothetical protein